MKHLIRLALTANLALLIATSSPNPPYYDTYDTGTIACDSADTFVPSAFHSLLFDEEAIADFNVTTTGTMQMHSMRADITVYNEGRDSCVTEIYYGPPSASTIVPGETPSEEWIYVDQIHTPDLQPVDKIIEVPIFATARGARIAVVGCTDTFVEMEFFVGLCDGEVPASNARVVVLTP